MAFLFSNSTASLKPPAVTLKAPPPSSSTLAMAGRSVSQEPSIPQSMSEEISCSICLDIMVHPQTIVPCGHSYCGMCLDTIKECPQCRETVTSRVPSRQLESLISMVVKMPNNGIDADDKAHYESRLKKETCRGFQDFSQPAKKRSKRSHSSSRRRSRTTMPLNEARMLAAAAGIPASITTTQTVTSSFQFGGSVTVRRQRQATSSSRQTPVDLFGPRVAPTSTSRVTRSAAAAPASSTFDPLTAPLPPPFDPEAAGAAPPAPPIWGLTGSNAGSTTNGSGFNFAPPTFTATAASSTAVSGASGPQGTSIEDAICID